MKRLLAILGLLIALPAWGGTYWVAPNGANGRTPTLDGSDSTLTHALSLQWFNDSCTAGDTCRISWGNYGTARIRPTHAGTPSDFIMYLGDTLSPGRVIVGEVKVDSLDGATRCITVKGVKATSASFTTTYCSYTGYDTLANSIILNTLSINGRKGMVVFGCVVGEGKDQDRFNVSNGLPSNVAYYCTTNPDGTVTATAITNNGSLRAKTVDSLWVHDNDFNLFVTSGATAINMGQVGHSVFERNRHELACGSRNDVHPYTMYGVKYCTFRDSYYSGTVIDNTGPHYLMNLRDNAVGNVFERDTLVESASSIGHFKIAFSTSGNDRDYGDKPDMADPQTDATCPLAANKLINACKTYDYGDSNNTVVDCVIRVGDFVEWQSQSDNFNFTGNVVAANAVTQPALWFVGLPSYCDSMVFRHNTIWSNQDKGFITNQGKLTNLTFTQNILIAARKSAGYGHYGPRLGGVSSFVRCDSNLVWCSEAPGDREFAVDLGGGATSRVGSDGTWCNAYGNDCASLWGDPQLTDTTSFLTFDPRPASDGYAYTGGLWADGYVGAIPASADTTFPVVTIIEPSGARIWNARDVMTIQWTATDDDAVSGITLEYAQGYGSTDWKPIATALDGSTTTYNWTTPTFTSAWGYIRVKAWDASGNTTSATTTFKTSASEHDIGPQRDEP